MQSQINEIENHYKTVKACPICSKNPNLDVKNSLIIKYGDVDAYLECEYCKYVEELKLDLVDV